MASTYSNLKIQLMATGENSGTWGNVTNDNLGVALEEAIVGSADVTFASANVTLTLTNTNASQTARNLRLNLTGTTGGARDLIVPAIEKVYIVNNGCADTVTIKVTGQTGIAVPAGKTLFVYNNGTDCVNAITHLTSLTLATALPIASGGTGSTSTTYANLQTNVTGTLPIANGGTGSASTTYANLQSNVSGVLPVANGGTGSATATFSGANVTSLNASSISSGTLAVARGGTGTGTTPTNGQLLIGNGSGFSLATITAGTAITVGTGSGTTTITNAGVTSVAGTSNQISVSGSTGAVTFSTPQSIATGSSVQFGSFGVGTAASGTTGEIRATNNVTAFYSSDRKFKENIKPIEGALDKVMSIGGKTFDWTDAYITEHGGEDGYFVNKADFGVIAQDVQAVFPQAVRTRDDGSLAVDYEKLSALAFAAIKELSEKVEKLGG